MQSALSDIRIVDLATDIAGSYACMLLGDMGADVVKVELAGSPNWRGDLPFHLWNRGKKSLGLDLEREGAREVLEKLVRQSDVLVESFLPSQAKAAVLDYESVSRLNPRLLYCAMPPFGEEGPLSDKPADDGVVAAFAAIMGDQTGPDQPPAFITIPASSYSASILACYAICSALYVREVEGIGQKIEVPLLNGALTVQGHHFIHAPDMTRETETQGDQQGTVPAYRLYECSDGKWMFIGCGNTAFWTRLCNVLGLERYLSEPRYENAPWVFEEQDRLDIIAQLTPIIARHPQEYWLDLFDKEDIPCAPADTRHDYAADPQVLHNGMIVDMDDPMLGNTRQMGLPVAMTLTPGEASTPASMNGEHVNGILESLGYDGPAVEELKKSGALTC
jgi:crotonobetainyl-CoA:carnitine CoA-transferase CaiB-like acyl-CoA transferase